MKLFSFVVVMGILRLGPLYLTNNFIFLCLLKQLFSLCLINSCGNASFVRFPFLGCVCITGCFLDTSIVAWKCCFLPDSCIPESNYDLLSCCSSFPFFFVGGLRRARIPYVSLRWLSFCLPFPSGLSGTGFNVRVALPLFCSPLFEVYFPAEK